LSSWVTQIGLGGSSSCPRIAAMTSLTHTGVKPRRNAALTVVVGSSPCSATKQTSRSREPTVRSDESAAGL
jgi:hypothetical protein